VFDCTQLFVSISEHRTAGHLRITPAYSIPNRKKLPTAKSLPIETLTFSGVAKEIIKLQVVVAVTNWTYFSEKQVPTPKQDKSFSDCVSCFFLKNVGILSEIGHDCLLPNVFYFLF
jgi:hypothetical protein